MSQGNNNNKLHPASSQTTCWLQIARGYHCTSRYHKRTAVRRYATGWLHDPSVVTSWAGCSGAPETRQMLGRERKGNDNESKLGV